MEFRPLVIKAVFSVIVIMGIFTLAKFVFNRDKGFEQWRKEFVLVNDATEINQKIKEIYCPPTIRCIGGAAFIILKDNKKYYFNTSHNQSNPISLTKIISVGDSISKIKGSDSLFLYKESGTLLYKFGIDTSDWRGKNEEF